jgi:hypothetical protein
MVENFAVAGRRGVPNFTRAFRAMEGARSVVGRRVGSRRVLVAVRTLRLIFDMVLFAVVETVLFSLQCLTIIKNCLGLIVRFLKLQPFKRHRLKLTSRICRAHPHPSTIGLPRDLIGSDMRVFAVSKRHSWKAQRFFFLFYKPVDWSVWKITLLSSLFDLIFLGVDYSICHSE